MAKETPKTRLGARDSKTGEFIPLKEADKRPNTTQKERIPKPGYGDTAKDKKKS